MKAQRTHHAGGLVKVDQRNYVLYLYYYESNSYFNCFFSLQVTGGTLSADYAKLDKKLAFKFVH